MMMNKKGFEMTITTIVALVLGLALLLALILLFTSEAGFFSNIIGGMQSKSNIDVVIQSCNSFLDSSREFSYCCEKRKVVAGNIKEELTCLELQNKSYSSGKINFFNCAQVTCPAE